MFGEVCLWQKSTYEEPNNLFHREIQILGNNSSSKDSCKLHLTELEDFDGKESSISPYFDLDVKDKAFGVVTLDRERCTSMISFGDISPRDEAKMCFEEVSFAAENVLEKDTEHGHFTGLDAEENCVSMISFGDIPQNGDDPLCMNEVFSATEDGCEHDYFTHIDDQSEPLENNEKFSNSSLTLAANRSLDLSRSLTDRCFQMANLAVTSESFVIDKLDVQKRRRPVSADVAISPESPSIQSMEAINGDNHFQLNSFTISAFPVSASSPFREENTLASVTNMQMSPKSTQRCHIVQEIVETERKYCSCLQLLLNHFAEKLSLSGILAPNDVQVIFPHCLRQIQDFHNEFLHKLEVRLRNWTKLSTVSDLIILIVDPVDCDLLKHYQTYVSLFPNSILHLRKLCRLNLEIERLIKELERDSCCQGLDISAYLLTPIQRIPRYVLLLKQLTKCTTESHPDFRLMDFCLAKLGDFLDKLNDSIQSSMKLVGSEMLPKQKRRFNFNTMSFRYNSASCTDASHASYTRHQKNSNSSKINRISLDLSFLGALKQKKEPEVVDKKSLSEICLRESEPVESCLPPGSHLTSTPLNSTVCQSFLSQKRTSQPSSSLKKSKRKLDESNIQTSTDATEVRSRLKKKLTKKTKNIEISKDADFSPKSTSSSACDSYVVDTFTPEKKSKLETLSEMLHLTPKKKGDLRRKTSVREAIKNFFVWKGSRKRNTYSQHNSTNDDNIQTNC